MEPTSVDDRFGEPLWEEPSRPRWRNVKPWHTAGLGGNTLVLKRVPAMAPGEWDYLWYVVRGDVLDAVGVAYSMLSMGGPAFITSVSVVRPAARGRGLYTKVLKALRKMVGNPIESDTKLSAGAVRAWEKAGGVPAVRRELDVLRLNPVRRAMMCVVR